MKNTLAETNPENKRRKFLKQLLAGTMASVAIPVIGKSISEEKQRPAWPLDKTVQNEAYWEMVKKQFPVPSNLIMLNAANLCPSPYFINELVASTMKELEMNVSFQFRSRFAEKRKKALEMMAAFIGVSKDEIGIVRNTTEANTLIVNGLDFERGDEVIIWDQNHPSNAIAWEQRAKRNGIIVKKVTLPPSPKSIDELMAPFFNAVTSKTKLISFSHISNISGMALPAKEICKTARDKNILTLVDGAQSLGMMDLNLHDMGCDFYTASTHKWLLGPFENGILYMRKENTQRLWPTVISAGWKETSTTVDEKLCVLGQRNETTPFALPETLEFHLSIGKKNIEDRVRSLSANLKEKIKAKVPQATFVTPLSPEMSAGIVIINLPGKQPAEVFQKLYEVHGIAGASSGGIRLSPHIYNTLSDLDKITDALAALAV